MAETLWTDDDVRMVVEAIYGPADHPAPLPGVNALGGRLENKAVAVLEAMTAAGWVRMDPNEPHLIEFRADGWTIQHPVRCRPNLFACKVNRVAGDQIDGPPATGLGVYGCDVDDGVFVLDHDRFEPAGDPKRARS